MSNNFDQCQDFSEDFDISGYKSHMLSATDANEVPVVGLLSSVHEPQGHVVLRLKTNVACVNRVLPVFSVSLRKREHVEN